MIAPGNPIEGAAMVDKLAAAEARIAELEALLAACEADK